MEDEPGVVLRIFYTAGFSTRSNIPSTLRIRQEKSHFKSGRPKATSWANNDAHPFGLLEPCRDCASCDRNGHILSCGAARNRPKPTARHLVVCSAPEPLNCRQTTYAIACKSIFCGHLRRSNPVRHDTRARECKRVQDSSRLATPLAFRVLLPRRVWAIPTSGCVSHRFA